MSENLAGSAPIDLTQTGGTTVAGVPAASARALTRVFDGPLGPVTALDRLDLDTYPGEVVALTGRSGTGKTTAINILCGLDFPTSGQATTLGVDVVSGNRPELTKLRRTRIGRVFQDSDLLDELSALDNVALAVQLRTGQGGRQSRETAAAVLEGFGLGERMAARPRQLSGGERQRVAIARAMAAKVALLIADEPTGSLDEANAIRVAEAFRAAAADGAAVVIATHDPVVVERADRIVRTDGPRDEAV